MDVELDLGVVVPQHVDIRERNLVQVIAEKLVLKVVKCHCKDVFLNLVLRTLIV